MIDWRNQAVANLRTWGEQTWPTLVLAFVEELGELAQAILEYYAEDGDPQRIPDELTDVGALGYQIVWKYQGRTPAGGRDD